MELSVWWERQTLIKGLHQCSQIRIAVRAGKVSQGTCKAGGASELTGAGWLGEGLLDPIWLHLPYSNTQMSPPPRGLLDHPISTTTALNLYHTLAGYTVFTVI